ncbi:DinB family protein [Phycicoccus flavus]|uniref:DinB family protein n=1 Tax=Phycicoccus flavus TaxID=2502783 RepID=A0A8T6R1T0_9MICO|nr:DinB family protein [Phycicoccus flavus]NHA68308.1 DinB family protein [Phycicoccus flavus]
MPADDETVPDPRPDTGDERAQLLGFLAGQRDALRRKCTGVDAAGLSAAHPPSTLTLGALLHHAAYTEDWWFTVCVGGGEMPPIWQALDVDADIDAEMTVSSTMTPDALLARYDEACARSDAVLAQVPDLGQRARSRSGPGEPGNVRWVVLHMIEETARHAGHADLLREAVDGSTGE